MPHSPQPGRRPARPLFCGRAVLFPGAGCGSCRPAPEKACRSVKRVTPDRSGGLRPGCRAVIPVSFPDQTINSFSMVQKFS